VEAYLHGISVIEKSSFNIDIRPRNDLFGSHQALEAAGFSGGMLIGAELL
jgi:hypothetical protein